MGVQGGVAARGTLRGLRPLCRKGRDKRAPPPAPTRPCKIHPRFGLLARAESIAAFPIRDGGANGGITMKDLNRVQLIGHLGQDPEVKYTEQGTARTTFSVATRAWGQISPRKPKATVPRASRAGKRATCAGVRRGGDQVRCACALRPRRPRGHGPARGWQLLGSRRPRQHYSSGSNRAGVIRRRGGVVLHANLSGCCRWHRRHAPRWAGRLVVRDAVVRTYLAATL